MSSTLASIKEYKGQRVSVLDWMDIIDQKVNHAISTENRKRIDNGELAFENAYTIDDIQFEDDEIKELVIMDKDTGLYIVPAIPLLTELKRCKPKYLDIMICALRNFFDIVIIDTSNNVSLFSITAINMRQYADCQCSQCAKPCNDRQIQTCLTAASVIG